jgi:hypothetical protein
MAADSVHIQHVDESLTLKGLKIVYDRNKAQRRGRRA